MRAARHPVRRAAVWSAYVSAFIVGLALLPTAFAVLDRGFVLRWSNQLLDLIGGT